MKLKDAYSLKESYDGKLHFYPLTPSRERLQWLNLHLDKVGCLLIAMKETYTVEHHGSVKRV